MTRPYQHPKTGTYWVRKAVPKELRPVIGKRELIRTLGTKNPDEARQLAPAVLAEFETVLANARSASGTGRRLTHREVMALCGVWYRREVAEFEDDPGPPEGWEAADDLLLDKLYCDPETGEPIEFRPREPDLAEARQFLAERGIAADPESVRTFARELFFTKRKAAAVLRRRAEGDYSSDPALTLFPPVPTMDAPKAPPQEPLKAEALLDAWAAERQPSAATRRKYAGTFRQLANVLGFDDVRRITPQDVVKFKQARLAEGRDTGTVEDDLRAAGAVCKWAVKNLMLPGNPFDGLAPKANRRGPAPRAPYDDEEAARILTAARSEKGWLRWLPWLLCFTGARISEIVELRRGDVRQEGGVWLLDVKPTDQRQGKNATFQRLLPLHPAVIAEGFLDYVAALSANPSGPLFPSLPPDPHGSRVGPATTRLGRWMRKRLGITDPAKAPAHSWRHRMEDELRKARASAEVQDAITGRHNPRNAGAGYGVGFRGMPAEVLRELEKVPSPVERGRLFSSIPS
jgi:integrase